MYISYHDITLTFPRHVAFERRRRKTKIFMTLVRTPLYIQMCFHMKCILISIFQNVSTTFLLTHLLALDLYHPNIFIHHYYRYATRTNSGPNYVL